jgi:hypothetical protein
MYIETNVSDNAGIIDRVIENYSCILPVERFTKMYMPDITHLEHIFTKLDLYNHEGNELVVESIMKDIPIEELLRAKTIVKIKEIEHLHAEIMSRLTIYKNTIQHIRYDKFAISRRQWYGDSMLRRSSSD